MVVLPIALGAVLISASVSLFIKAMEAPPTNVVILWIGTFSCLVLGLSAFGIGCIFITKEQRRLGHENEARETREAAREKREKAREKREKAREQREIEMHEQLKSTWETIQLIESSKGNKDT